MAVIVCPRQHPEMSCCLPAFRALRVIPCLPFWICQLPGPQPTRLGFMGSVLLLPASHWGMGCSGGLSKASPCQSQGSPGPSCCPGMYLQKENVGSLYCRFFKPLWFGSGSPPSPELSPGARIKSPFARTNQCSCARLCFPPTSPVPSHLLWSGDGVAQRFLSSSLSFMA